VNSPRLGSLGCLSCFETRSHRPSTLYSSSVSPILSLRVGQQLFKLRDPAPRDRNIWGPLATQGPVHQCFPWVIWRDLQRVSPSRTNQEGRCIPGCPEQLAVRRLNRRQLGYPVDSRHLAGRGTTPHHLSNTSPPLGLGE
jgi:hypothetical protein